MEAATVRVALTVGVTLATAVPEGVPFAETAPVGVTDGVVEFCVAVGSGVVVIASVAVGLAVTVGGAVVAVGGKLVGVSGAAATTTTVGAGAASGVDRSPVHAARSDKMIRGRKVELRVIGLSN